MGKFRTIPSYYMIPNSEGEWLSSGALIFYSSLLKLDIKVPKYTITNLASIPKLLRPMFSVNGPHRPMAAIHDYLYERKGKLLCGTVLTRKQCDLVFLEAMEAARSSYYKALPGPYKDALVEHGKSSYFKSSKPLVGYIKRNMMYNGVRAGGIFHW